MNIKRTTVRMEVPQEEPMERLVPGTPGVVETTKNNSTALGRNLFKEFDPIPLDSYKEDARVHDYNRKKQLPKHEAQHIIPVEIATEHSLIKKLGMDVNHPSNGIVLPTPGTVGHALSTHKGYHEVYSSYVRKELDRIERELGPNASITEIDRAVYELKEDLRSALEDGTPMYKAKKDPMGIKNPNNRKEVSDRGGGATEELFEHVIGRYRAKRN